MPSPPDPQLLELARLHGVQPSYSDATGRDTHASTSSLLATLSALRGEPLDMAGVAGALRSRRDESTRPGVDPVTVAWEAEPSAAFVWLPRARSEDTLACTLELEDGSVRTFVADLSQQLPSATAGEPMDRVRKCVPLPAGLPWGRHRLRVEGSGTGSSLVIAAPKHAQPPPPRSWGVFAPLHAMRSEASLGAGNLTDAGRLLDLVASRGGHHLGTLPLLASFLDVPYEPSPYSPVSRLFWNELYLDLRAVPEVAGSRAAREALDGPAARELVAELRSLRDAQADWRATDPRRQAHLQRDVLARISALTPARQALLDGFLRERPEVEDHAAFRAVTERQGRTWQAWPAALRDGVLGPDDGDAAARRHHVLAQWLMDEQLAALSGRGASLYLDLPIGVNAGGYDAWRFRELFGAAAAGAPPDLLFSGGQDWGLLPFHPDRVREDGYAYLAACLRHQMRRAGMLRIDHVMAFHRLYWVPRGASALDGAYVRYRSEEMLAVACLESRRSGCALVGENLGTVPPEVETAMREHGLQRMHVTEYALAGRGASLTAPAGDEVASVNTHDMPTFAAWLAADDVRDRLGSGQLDEASAHDEIAARRETVARLSLTLCGSVDADATSLLEALLRELGASPASVVIATLEDFWLELAPQNVPGTGEERLNWRRRARLQVEDLESDPRVSRLLDALSTSRRARPAP